MSVKAIISDLKQVASQEKADFLPGFFRAHPGGYGEGDKFLGVAVPEQRNIARRVFFFDRLPYVSRVIFIAAPHRGSHWADHRIGRLGSSLVELPLNLVKTSMDLLKNVVTKPLTLARQGDTAYKIDHVPTGIEALSPGNPMFAVLDQIPIENGIPYHSIIGNTEAANTPGGTDGVVPYESSHLEGAASEKIVLSGHSAHNHPLAILEVHRILMQHLENLGIVDDTQDPPD